MKEQAYTDKPQRPVRWYNRYQFPIVPQYDYRPGDAYNPPSWWFRWLFIQLWTLDHADFELALVCSTHWGIGFVGIVPYLRWVFAVPIPEKWGMWFNGWTGKRSLSQRLPKTYRGRYYD